MALFEYMRRTQRILRDQRVQFVNPTDLIAWVNEARGQIAGEAECVLAVGSLAVTSASQVYPFTSVTFSSGIAGALNVRTLWRVVASTGKTWMVPRPWPWFSLYNLTTPQITPAAPKIWAQYGQGAGGSVYVSPTPDTNYTLSVDAMCYPNRLALDTDVDVIPYLWTDAVAYYAAYLAMLAMQTGGNTRESDAMYKRYQEYVARARMAANPSILPSNYTRSQPIPSNQLGGGSAPPQGGQ